MIVLCDIDFTICDSSHRTHYLQDPVDWIGFYDPVEVAKDKPNIYMHRLLQTLGKEHYIIYVTSRVEMASEVTYDWLENNKFTFPHFDVYFRKNGDERESHIVKKDFLQRIRVDYHKVDVLCAFEDKPKIVQMYREEGILCFSLPEGDHQGN